MSHVHPLQLTNASTLMSIAFFIIYIGYLSAVLYSNKRFNNWPLYRFILFTLGIFCLVIATSGPLAKLAHESFSFHMVSHLLLGMIAPLLIVLSAPMTLLFRSLSTKTAKRLTYFLRRKPIQLLLHPIVTSILNMGGLWLLYTTNIYTLMHEHTLLYLFIHLHVFFAGYLFTASIIYIDPIAHRISYLFRSIVLVLALSSHAILAKNIYAFPPTGVLRHDAEIGGMLMYYGGDLVDLIIIIILCNEWYKSARPKLRQSNANQKIPAQ